MSELQILINRLAEFGTNPDVKSENNVRELQKLLVGIYSEYLKVKSVFDDTDYEEEPDFDYKEIRKNLESNFPDFGFYGCVMDSSKIVPEKEDIGTGDALDDLTDIIKDLLVVRWKMENTSTDDAVWDFEFSMRTHSEQHLVDLLKYLKDSTE